MLCFNARQLTARAPIYHKLYIFKKKLQAIHLMLYKR